MVLRTARKDHAQKGQALLEMAIIIPLLIFLLLCTVDLGRALYQYLSLTQIVYEGVRQAATYPGMTVIDTAAAADGSALEDLLNVNDGHKTVHERIDRLLDDSGFDPQYRRVDTFFSGAIAGATATDQSNYFRVRVKVEFRAWFYLFDGIEIAAEAHTPYLFRDENVFPG